METKPSLVTLFLWKSVFPALNNKHECTFLEIYSFINQEFLASSFPIHSILWKGDILYFFIIFLCFKKKSSQLFTNCTVTRLPLQALWHHQIPPGYEHGGPRLSLFTPCSLGHRGGTWKNQQPGHASAQPRLHFDMTWGAFTVIHFGGPTPQTFQFTLSRVGQIILLKAL